MTDYLFGSFSFSDAILAWAMGIDKRRVVFSIGALKERVSSRSRVRYRPTDPRQGTRRVGGFLLIKHKERLPLLSSLYMSPESPAASFSSLFICIER